MFLHLVGWQTFWLFTKVQLWLIKMFLMTERVRQHMRTLKQKLLNGIQPSFISQCRLWKRLISVNIVMSATQVTFLQTTDTLKYVSIFTQTWTVVMLQVIRLQSQWPLLKSGFQHLYVWPHWMIFKENVGTISDFSSCLWWWKQIFQTKIWSFPHSNQAFFEPK